MNALQFSTICTIIDAFPGIRNKVDIKWISTFGSHGSQLFCDSVSCVFCVPGEIPHLEFNNNNNN